MYSYLRRTKGAMLAIALSMAMPSHLTSKYVDITDSQSTLNPSTVWYGNASRSALYQKRGYTYYPIKSGYSALNPKTYGYRTYLRNLEAEFLYAINTLALSLQMDANVLAAHIHHESLYSPQQFNLNWYIISSGQKYYPSGDGGVGLIQCNEHWRSGMKAYTFSCLTRRRQLDVIGTTLRYYKTKGYSYAHPGAFGFLISQRYTNDWWAWYITDPDAGHAGAMYFTDAPTSYNNGLPVPYDRERKLYLTATETENNIERKHYRKHAL